MEKKSAPVVSVAPAKVPWYLKLLNAVGQAIGQAKFGS